MAFREVILDDTILPFQVELDGERGPDELAEPLDHLSDDASISTVRLANGGEYNVHSPETPHNMSPGVHRELAIGGLVTPKVMSRLTGKSEERLGRYRTILFDEVEARMMRGQEATIHTLANAIHVGFQTSVGLLKVTVPTRQSLRDANLPASLRRQHALEMLAEGNTKDQMAKVLGGRRDVDQAIKEIYMKYGIASEPIAVRMPTVIRMGHLSGRLPIEPLVRRPKQA